MKKDYTTFKLFAGYLVIIWLMIMANSAQAQTLKLGDDLTVVHFNAGWNSANDVEWFTDLGDCKRKTCDIASDSKAGSKHEIVVVPTVIIARIVLTRGVNE